MKEWMVSEAESGARSFRYVTRILPGAPVGLLRKSLRKNRRKSQVSSLPGHIRIQSRSFPAFRSVQRWLPW